MKASILELMTECIARYNFVASTQREPFEHVFSVKFKAYKAPSTDVPEDIRFIVMLGSFHSEGKTLTGTLEKLSHELGKAMMVQKRYHEDALKKLNRAVDVDSVAKHWREINAP